MAQSPEVDGLDEPSGAFRQSLQVRFSLARNRARAGVALVLKAMPNLSLGLLLFSSGWIACNISYHVKAIPVLTAKAKIADRDQAKVIPSLVRQRDSAKGEAAKAKAEVRAVREFTGLTDPVINDPDMNARAVPAIRPIPRPEP